MIRIAVADDEQLARYNLVSILRENFPNLHIIEAEHGQELLHLIQDHQVDIALIDIRMPRMDGLEVMKHCKHRDTIPWAIVSSYADFPYAKQAILLGAQGYILKPPDPIEVRDTTQKLIHRFEELQKSKIDKLQTYWFQLLQRQHESLAVISETASDDQHKDKEHYLPCIISLQGATFPHGEIEQIILNNCWDPTDKGITLLYPHKAFGFLEIVCAATHRIDTSTWKRTMGNHLLARLQHDFSLYKFKIILGESCNSIESAAHQIHTIQGILNFEPLLPTLCLTLEEASQALLPYATNELEAAHQVVMLFRHWHRHDWIICKNLVIDLFLTLNTIDKAMQHQLLVYLEKALWLSPTLSQHLLTDGYLEEIKQEMLGIIQQKQTTLKVDPLTEILRFIDRHFTEAISLSQIADLFGFSPNYLSTLFHQKTGTTYTRYVTNLRMKEARNLLRSGISVKETAWTVGYTDEQHFAELYKKIMGIAPGSEKKYGHPFLTSS
jgi:two-component system response regulator YesN